VAVPLVLAACQAEVIRHGHIAQEEDIAQVQVGMSRDQVFLALGTPDTQTTVGQGAAYYISTTTSRQLTFLEPRVVDRRVLAVYFDNNDRVQQIANYGLKDGKVFDFIKRETPSYSRDEGLIRSIFRNIGRPGAGAVPAQ
jgi:outer membrane protein assembly factor BamE (lipoprotein component of BamABCDE complex)